MIENIRMIEVNRIYPHPNNPRKDLGDLTELADSIKANGIMQNLTVVPWVSNAEAKKHMLDIMAYMVKVSLEHEWYYPHHKTVSDMLDVELDDDSTFDTIAEKFATAPEKTFLVSIYSCWDDSPSVHYYNKFTHKHDENYFLDTLYDFLVKLGYEMSMKSASSEMVRMNYLSVMMKATRRRGR